MLIDMVTHTPALRQVAPVRPLPEPRIARQPFTRVCIYQDPFERNVWLCKIVDPQAVNYVTRWVDGATPLQAYASAMSEAQLSAVSDDTRVEVWADMSDRCCEKTLYLTDGAHDTIEALIAAEVS